MALQHASAGRRDGHRMHRLKVRSMPRSGSALDQRKARWSRWVGRSCRILRVGPIARFPNVYLVPGEVPVHLTVEAVD